MSLLLFDHEYPIIQGTRDFFQPLGHCDVTPWREVITPFREMERQMRELDRQFDRVSRGQMSRDNAAAAMQRLVSQDPVVVDSDGKRKYRLNFDVRQFTPEEIQLKTKDNVLSLHAKHESTTGGRKTYREFHQNCSIPEEIDVKNLTSVLSPDGVLTVEAPLPVTYKAKDSELQEKKDVPMSIDHQ